jgi:hypothetical protein
LEHHTIGAFDLAIGPWVCHGSPVDSDVLGIVEVKETLPCELRAVVGDDGVRHPKAVDDVADEGDHLFSCDRGNRLSLDPLGELVHRNEEMREAPGCPLKRADQIQPLDREGPCEGDGVERLRREMCLPSIILAPIAGAYYVLGISHSSWPVETMAKSHAYQHLWCSVVTAGSRVDVDEQLLPLIPRDALLEDSRSTAFVKVIADHHKRLCVASETLGLSLVPWEDVAQEIADIWAYPVTVDEHDLSPRVTWVGADAFHGLEGRITRRVLVGPESGGRLVLLVDENSIRDGVPVGAEFRQLVCVVVVAPEDVT